MSRHLRFAVLSGVLLFMLLAGLACPAAVHADDETPPPAATEAVQSPPTEAGGSETTPPPSEAPNQLTEVPVVQEPAATETPIAREESTATPTEEPVVGEADNIPPVIENEVTKAVEDSNTAE